MSAWTLLAWLPFVNPIPLPAGLRLWTFLPLAACVAVVYRATRATDLRGLPRAAAITFAQIVAGMCAIALGAYVLHEAVLRIG